MNYFLTSFSIFFISLNLNAQTQKLEEIQKATSPIMQTAADQAKALTNKANEFKTGGEDKVYFKIYKLNSDFTKKPSETSSRNRSRDTKWYG